ncbi:MAG: PilW family protein [Ilumatobacteraceae bacterium]
MQTHLRRRGRRQDGFTLVELLVSMIIMGIVTTMLVGIWISLQRSFFFTRSDNTATTTARTALDRVTSELRSAQPPTTAATTPFCLTLSSPYVCDGYDCVFYSPYNNTLAATQTNPNGRGQSILTAIYLDTSGTQAQKKLYWVRDTNGSGGFDAGDKKILLADNVVNTAASVNKPIFQYVIHPTPNASFAPASSLASANVGQVVAVNIEVVIDANVAHTPTYVDLVSTVRPRNVATN